MNFNEKVKLLDGSNMFQHLKDFPNQILESIKICSNSPYFPNKHQKFILLGMGGSAIAGDLLQSFFRNSKFNGAEIFTNRNYQLMKSINYETNLIVSSYSGNTEETLEAYSTAKNITNNIIGITSGGKLVELMIRDGFEFIQIPKGLQPREALGYSFFTLLLTLIKSIGNEKDYANMINLLKKLYEFLSKKSLDYSNFEFNQAINLAKAIKNKIVVIYSTEETMFPVALRFKAQIQENSKNLAFCGLIPEMNHNEINSFVHPADLVGKIKMILLKDPNDHPKNKKRIEAVFSVFNKDLETELLESSENEFLFRMFDLIYLLDWTSFYLALENNVDPTPIPVIKKLKEYIQS